MAFKVGDRVAVIRKKMPPLKGTVRERDRFMNFCRVEIDGQKVPPKWVHEDRLEALDD